MNGRFIFSVFEDTHKDRSLNSFLIYSHSDEYLTTLADSLNLEISYRQKDIHEYHNGVPVRAIIYVLKKNYVVSISSSFSARFSLIAEDFVVC